MVLRFSRQQYETLCQRNEKNFVDTILTAVRELHPENRLPDEVLRRDIGAGIGRAHGHDLRSDAQVSEYVLVMFEVAPNFDRQPDIRRVLADTALPPSERWERLFEPDMDAAWADADRPDFYDERFWWPEGYGFADDAPKPEALTDEDWGALAFTLAYMKQYPETERVREPTPEELARFTQAYREQRRRSQA